MWPFNNKTDNGKTVEIPVKQMEDMFQMLEAVQAGKINEAIEGEIRKSLSLTDFQAIDSHTEGGHFGLEFPLRPTAQRIKMLHAREPWVFATSSLIARTLANIPFIVIDNSTDDVNETHEANQIVSGGNPMQDAIHKKWSGYLDLILGGNYFEILDENYQFSHHVPVELAEPVLRQTDTPEKRARFESDGPFEALEIYDVETGKAVQRVPWEQVVHHKYPNPFNPFYGLSMYVAAARPILLDRHKHEFEMAFYLRGATNAGVIETTEDITKSRMTRLMSTFEQTFTGKRNWWRTLFLPKGAKWVNSGLNMKEMEHLEGLRENRRTLLAVLGVPPSQIGIVEDVNRATAEVQEMSFYQNTIMPLAEFIAAGYNNSHLFRNIYSDEVRIEPDFSGIDAVEGSLLTKAERAKAVDDIAVINEQREICGYDPLPTSDPRGNLFASELKKLDPNANFENVDDDEPTDDDDPSKSLGSVAVEIGPASNDAHTHVGEFEPETGIGKTIATNGAEDHVHRIRPIDGNPDLLEVEPSTGDGHTHPNIDRLERDRLQIIERSKKNATRNQRRIEKIQTEKYVRAYDNVRLSALRTAENALRGKKDVRAHLNGFMEDRLSLYGEKVMPVLIDSMEKGWDMGLSQTRSLTNAVRKKISRKQSDRISPEDEQALTAIRERTADGRRRSLDERNIQSFLGFDETQTEQIVGVVEDGLRNGKTFDEIASTIRKDYGERYGDQAFTIARTETLTAVSMGIKANNDALNEVFSKVNKQWFHVGDSLTNPDARVTHAAFEKQGVVPSNHIWVSEKTGARMAFPRDPAGGAADVINCRCTMVSVIPDDATSNARGILEG